VRSRWICIDNIEGRRAARRAKSVSAIENKCPEAARHKFHIWPRRRQATSCRQFRLHIVIHDRSRPSELAASGASSLAQMRSRALGRVAVAIRQPCSGIEALAFSSLPARVACATGAFSVKRVEASAF